MTSEPHRSENAERVRRLQIDSVILRSLGAICEAIRSTHECTGRNYHDLGTAADCCLHMQREVDGELGEIYIDEEMMGHD